MISRPRSVLATAALAALAAASTTSCAAFSDDSGAGVAGSAGSGTSGGTGQALQVVAAFYPLQYLVERIGGDAVSVTTLTKPGAEPHDLELTPRDVADTQSAQLVVYEKDFQSAVDDAVASGSGDNALDVSTAADLSLKVTDEEGATVIDPHFWLDPVRYAAVAKAVADRLAEADPTHAQMYAANLAALTKDLDALNGAYGSGLKSCANRTLVTGHAAFGYLSQRYGFTQRAVTGVSPDAEPDPTALAAVAAFVKKNKVTTVYAETLVSPALARTVAQETGATVAVLDPIEGITDTSAAKDYLGLMRADLATLKKGQSCS